jgi:hypothetical protein
VTSKSDPVAQFIRRKYRYADEAIQDRLLYRASLADRWDCSTESIRRLEGTVLRPIRIGGRVRYRLSDILRAEREGELVP